MMTRTSGLRPRTDPAPTETETPRAARLHRLRRHVAAWDPRDSWPGYLLAAGVVLALVFTFLDPGPSRGLGPFQRLVFWILHVLLPLAILQATQIALSRAAWIDRLHGWAQVGLSGVIGAALFAPFALLFDRLFALPGEGSELGEPLARQLGSEFVSFLPASILVWAGLNATRLLRLPAPSPSDPVEAPSDPAAAFWARLPRHLGRDLVALTAELHYLRVYTTRGDTLILYSFGRATEELGARGYQVHRSHWVAAAHFEVVEREGDRTFCKMDTGLTLPLSRPYRRKMRDLADAGSGRPD